MDSDQYGAGRGVPSHVTSVSVEPESAKVTARRVRKHRVHGHFAMPGGTSMPWFDELCRDLMCLLAVDHGVRSFTPRPEKLRPSIDGKIVEHTPDFRVERVSETAIVDVEQPRKNNDGADLEIAMRRICAQQGLHYSRITRDTIYKQPRFDNARELLRSKSVEPTPEFTFQVVDLLSRTGGGASRGAIEDALGGGDLVLGSLYALALRRVVAIDMGKPLSRDAGVFLLADSVAGP